MTRHQIWVSDDTLDTLWALKVRLFPGRAPGAISHDDVIRRLAEGVVDTTPATSTTT